MQNTGCVVVEDSSVKAVNTTTFGHIILENLCGGCCYAVNIRHTGNNWTILMQRQKENLLHKTWPV